MTVEDKSLGNSVNIFSRIHEINRQDIKKENERIREAYLNPKEARKAGRQRETIGRVPKSKQKPISKAASGYSQARKRLPTEVLDAVYKESKDFSGIKYPGEWHGKRVFITDGTYLQMQDTKEIKEKFSCPESKGYPRGLLEIIIEQGSGAVYNFALDSDNKSELELISGMINSVPRGSLLLADDLYNCFAIFSLLKAQGVDIIAPGKRPRNFSLIKTIGKGDEIIKIKKTSDSKWLNGKEISDNELLMRRIEYNSASIEGKTLVLYTSLLDPEISKEDIILKYESRWDIEISIREMKTIMDVNIVRSKTPELALKELYAALIAYNYIRKIISKAAENSAFSPEGDIIFKCYENHKQFLVDKLGRRYSKWSPGRRGYDKD
jgi:hypothetical protein